jgi:transposase
VSDLEQRLAALEATVAERDATIAERDATIAELRSTNARLEKRVADLENKLGQNSSNSSLPPSTDRGQNPHRNAKKGAKPRKRKKSRGGGRHRDLLPPEQVDAFHDHFPAECGGCGERLPRTADAEPQRHQVTELPEIRPRVDEHRLHAVACRCGCVTRAELPEGVSRSAFGPRLIATVALLTGLYRLSKRSTRRILSELFGVTISTGAVSNCERRVGAALKLPHEELHRFVQSEPVLHADETSWQQKHRTHWLWVACTCAVSLFVIQARRCTDSARQLLGSFDGTLVTDRLASYGFWAGPRQTCWAHLKRTFQALAEYKGGAAAAFGVPLLEQTKKMFVLVRRVRDGTLQHATLQRRMEPIRAEIERLLEEAAMSPCVHTQGKAKAILEHRDALWTFVHDPAVEPTNNEAERALRHAVILRKLTFGTQSERGSRFIERMLSTVDTLRKQDRAVLGFLMDALHAEDSDATPPSLLPAAG